MKTLPLLWLAIFVSCNQQEQKLIEEPKLTYEETIKKYLATNPPEEPAFLKFQFGASKKQTDAHIDSLIKAGKIEDRTSVTFSVINYKVSGWPYRLYMSEHEPVTTIFDVFYQNDSLYKISILPIGIFAQSRLQQFLIEQYGKPSYWSLDTSKTYGSPDTMFFWLKGAHDISYSPKAFNPIGFFDLKTKLRVINNERVKDSMTRVIEKDAAGEAKKDFQ